jgi:hypothetical protein
MYFNNDSSVKDNLVTKVGVSIPIIELNPDPEKCNPKEGDFIFFKDNNKYYPGIIESKKDINFTIIRYLNEEMYKTSIHNNNIYCPTDPTIFKSALPETMEGGNKTNKTSMKRRLRSIMKSRINNKKSIKYTRRNKKGSRRISLR